ncbi:hypothetical protein [Terriglobus aquaticus]|uniref:His Kinase A (Phospho-acceptor) domain-containing protein n=1 Tax=Terriglobus aquaticus TaxID=940139 RepID=A0ABW9KNN4_9BACT|nr:hypothetical protein [Terriglobus aquaticus]
MSGTYISVNRERAHGILHALSQPLTVMSLALTMMQGSADEAERAQALEAVMVECQRAMRSVYQLRSLLDEAVDAGRGLEAPAPGETAWVDRSFGGMA